MWVWVGGGVPYVPLTYNTSINLTRMKKQSTSCRHLLKPSRAERGEAIPYSRFKHHLLFYIYYYLKDKKLSLRLSIRLIGLAAQLQVDLNFVLAVNIFLDVLGSVGRIFFTRNKSPGSGSFI